MKKSLTSHSDLEGSLQVHPTTPQHVPATEKQVLLRYIQLTRMWDSDVALVAEGGIARNLSGRFG